MDDKVLLNVEIDAQGALESYGKLRIRIDELRDAQKKLKEIGLENSEVYFDIEQKIKALSSRAQEYQKTVQQNVKVNHEEEGSLQQLKARLSLLTAEYNKLSRDARNAKEGVEMGKEIAALTKELTDAEKALGNFRRQVGNYELVAQQLGYDMDGLTKSLIDMRLEGKQDTEEYRKMSAALADMKKESEEITKVMKQVEDSLSSPNIAKSINMLNQNLTMLSVATKELGIGVPELQEAIASVTSATSLWSVVSQAKQAWDAKDIVLQNLRTKQEQRQAKAIAAKTAAQSASTVVTKVATTATWLWNAALAANPIVLIAAAIVAATAAVAVFATGLVKQARARKEAEKAEEAYAQKEREVAEQTSKINAKRTREVNDISSAMRQEIVEMQKRGANEEEIAEYRLKREQEIRDIELDASRLRQAENEKLIAEKDELILKEEKYLSELKEGSKKYKEQKKKVDELRMSLIELKNIQAEEKQNDRDILLQNIEAEQKAAEERKKRAQKQAADQAALDKTIADDKLKQQREADEMALDLSDASAAERFKHQQEWDKKMFEANQDYEKRKLKRQRANGEITEQEYKNQLAKLVAAEDAFIISQANAAKKQVLSQYKSILDSVGKETQKVIQEIDTAVIDNLAVVTQQLGIDEAFKKEYSNLEKEIAMFDEARSRFADSGASFASGATEQEDRKRFEEMKAKMFEYYRIEAELKRQAEEKKTAIEQAEVDKRLERVYKDIEDGNALDLLDFTKTETQKTDIAIEQSRKRIAALKQEAEKESDPKVKLELQKRIAQEENSIRENELKNIQNGLAKELADTTLSAQRKYTIKQEYLQKELEAIRGNAEAEEDINRQMAENRKEYLNSVADSLSEWGGKAVEVANSISNLMSAIGERQVQEYEEQNERQAEVLKSRLDRGLISQEEYDKQVEQNNKELEKKKAEADLRAAKRQKAIGIMEAAINTATAIMKIWAEVPKGDWGASTIALAAVASTLGAIQMATIAAQPLPKASRGMLLRGPSHAQGGIPIEAEGGEAIINKKATSRYLPLLSAINESTGGVPLYARGGVPQQIMKQSHTPIDYNALAEAMSHVQLHSQVAVTDINRGQADMVRVVNRKNY